MKRKFHSTPFDEPTKQKLIIFRKYLECWLPVFINQQSSNTWNRQINVYDFFCGPGLDSKGYKGSPLLTIETCLKFSKQLKKQSKGICLHFSDASQGHITELRKNLENVELPPEITVEVSKTSFEEAFDDCQSELKNSSNLLFIDQCGIKEVNPIVFDDLINLKSTDFIFFIASSFFGRFSKSEEFKQYLDVTEHIENVAYKDMHRKIAGFYKELIPEGQEYFLAPYSLKKGANIYGLIFGTGNLAGLDRFVKIAWNQDPDQGESNFDIDGEHLPKSGEPLNLFESNTKSTKVIAFQEELRNLVLGGNFNTDSDVYKFTLESGFYPTMHAKEVLAKLKSSGDIAIEGMLRLSSACLKSPRKIKIQPSKE